jgi:hypothetical protein
MYEFLGSRKTLVNGDHSNKLHMEKVSTQVVIFFLNVKYIIEMYQDFS